MKFVVCLENERLGNFSSDDLTIGRLYEVIDDIDVHGMVRIIDDSGEDYLYSAKLFEPLEIPIKIAERLHKLFKSA